MSLKSAMLAAFAAAIISAASLTPAALAQVGVTIEQLVPDLRPSGELNESEIAGRIDALNAALQQDGLQKDVKQQLRRLLKADKQALKSIASGGEQQAADPAIDNGAGEAEKPKKRKKSNASGDAGAEQPTEQAVEPVAEPKPEVAIEPAVVPEAPVEQAADPAAEAQADPSADKIVEPGQADATEQPVEKAEKPKKKKKVDPDAVDEQPVEQAVEPSDAPTEQPAELAAEPVQDPPVDAEVVEQAQPAVEPTPLPDTPAVAPEFEDKAQAMLNDGTAADQLDKDALKARLDAMRDLLDEGNIEPATAQALRKQLKTERDILRALIAKEDAAEAKAAEANAGANPEIAVVVPLAPVAAPTVAEIPKIVADERVAENLGDRELNRRVRGFKATLGDKRFKKERQREYAESMKQDRTELKRRLLKKKKQRVAYYQTQKKQPKIEVNIILGLNLEQRETPSVWAAEAEDEEIEHYLVARPVRKLSKQYRAPRRVIFEQPERFVARREVREALPSVEIDTINFGFGEAIVREEEIVNLDRIGLALERILFSHPEEVFLIEGHTDAVGSEASNQRLSKARAIAVKQALTSYYTIPPEALATVGLGERYLKIWTPEPEQENRRVTLRRLTSLVSEDDSYGVDSQLGVDDSSGNDEYPN